MQIGICMPPPDFALASRLVSAGCDYYEPPMAQSIMAKDAPGFDASLETWTVGGLRARSANVFLPGELSIVGEGLDRTARDAYMHEALRRAKALGLRVVVFGSGTARTVPAGFPYEEALLQFGEALVLAANLASPEITICLEHLRHAETNLVNSLEEAGELAEELGTPGLCLVVDGFHLLEENEDPSVVRRFPELVRHVHVSGPNRKPPSESDVSQLTGLFRELVAINYEGSCSLECNWSDLAEEGSASLSTVRSVAESVGLA